MTVHDQPIPWCAEAVLVEVLLHVPGIGPFCEADFQLRVGGQEPSCSKRLHHEAGGELLRLLFRFAPPGQSETAEVVFRNRHLGQLMLPALGREQFVNHLQALMPTLFVRFGDQSVACRTFVATQCRGLLASAVVTSPTSLVPLLDLDLRVEFRTGRGRAVHTMPAPLCISQLAGNQALIVAVPRSFPRRVGAWVATWVVGDRLLASQQMHAVSQRRFCKSLRIEDSRFVVRRAMQGVSVTRYVPPPDGVASVGPSFLVSSREPGMAGLCTLQVRARAPGGVQPSLLAEKEILITDGPTEFAWGTVDVGRLSQVSAFELGINGGTLGVLPLFAIPRARFTSEGGFDPPYDFPWSAAAENQLNDRLCRLLEECGNDG